MVIGNLVLEIGEFALEGFEGGLGAFELAESGFGRLAFGDGATDAIMFGGVVADFFEFGVNLGESGAGFEGEVVFSELRLNGGELREAGFKPGFFSGENLSEAGFEGGEFGVVSAVGDVEGLQIGDLRLEITNQVIRLFEEGLVGAILVAFVFAVGFEFGDEAGAVIEGERLAAERASSAFGGFEAVNALFEVVHFGAEAGVLGFGFGLAVEGGLKIGFEGRAVGEFRIEI